MARQARPCREEDSELLIAETVLTVKIETFRSLHRFAFGVPRAFHPIVIQRPDRAAMVTVG